MHGHATRVRSPRLHHQAQDSRLSRRYRADRRRDRRAVRHLQAGGVAAPLGARERRPGDAREARPVRPLPARRGQSRQHPQRLPAGSLPGLAPAQAREQGAREERELALETRTLLAAALAALLASPAAAQTVTADATNRTLTSD